MCLASATQKNYTFVIHMNQPCKCKEINIETCVLFERHAVTLVMYARR